jgi:ribonuclease E
MRPEPFDMSKKMLVDASHPEETRVVVLSGNRVEEFDYENAGKLQLKGNIYLAKVTRVEPSLQACFVEYGGNRHGFLPFSEIHPDYYRIPKEDRLALMEAERAADRGRALDDEDDEDEQSDAVEQHAAHDTGRQHAIHGEQPSDDGYDAQPGDAPGDINGSGPEGADGWVPQDQPRLEADALTSETDAGQFDEFSSDSAVPMGEPTAEIVSVDTGTPPEEIETIGSEDALEEVPTRKSRHMRRYKIQEVIARKQILLIQVVKEERGSKGAALTTFLSLAGRYCVLMPNTDRGGGISRKIANPADRRKLKELASELDVPDGMGLIIRTAGANRTKQEIRRDYEYLIREWEAVRDLTLKSTAPALVYEEGSLIKRAIRDLFTKDIDQIVVEGDAGHEEARDFMRLIMPSQMDMIEKFSQPLPLYQAYGVEAQLDSMFQPTVRLRSGGYIVINQTEALVAVDVNSGKATREHNIEDTALKTNLEAAEEVARQLRLRDLAGLIVIDFIDMQEGRNNRHVEKRLKDSLKWDRARIQVGRISPFGLLEMSRQRLRSGMVEGSTVSCPHCEGRGFIRSVGSMALRVLRAVEEHCQRQKEQAITLRLPPEIAIYILNHKRAQLSGIEDRYGVYIYIEAKPSLTASTYEIERGAAVQPEPRRARKPATAVSLGAVFEEFPIEDEPAEEDDEDEAVASQTAEEEPTTAPQSGGEDRSGRKRRRRRGRGNREGNEPREHQHQARDGQQNRPAPQAPRPQSASDRPFGVPSPAEFNFSHHDLPDTTPEADDDDLDAAAQGDDGQTGDADGTNGQNPRAQDQDGERRRRRGRRGRRGRGRDRDRDGPRTNANGAEGETDERPWREPRAERPLTESGIAAEPPQDTTFAHPTLVRPQPQFSLTPVASETPSAPEPVQSPPPPKPEPKSEWRLSSLFGFGSREAPKEPPRVAQAQVQPSAAAQAPAPEPAPIVTEAETLRRPEPVAVEPEPVGPKRGGWWQKRE